MFIDLKYFVRLFLLIGHLIMLTNFKKNLNQPNILTLHENLMGLPSLGGNKGLSNWC